MKFYKHIDDMPIYNWNKIVEGGDFTWCAVKRKGAEDVGRCKAAYQILYDQFIDAFGINESLREIIELKNQILVMEIDKALSDDSSTQIFIDVKKAELNKLEQQASVKTVNTKAYVEKYLGFRIDEKVVSVSEYYNYIKNMNDERRN